MEGQWSDGLVVVGGDARNRFHEARGYGRPRGDELALAPVEAAHLLARSDLAAVDGLGFESFLAEVGNVLEFVVYSDLRERGLYLSPAREDWVENPEGIDFVVHPRGTGPAEGRVLYRLRVLGERESIRVAELGDLVLAVVDEDGELTYFDTDRPSMNGSAMTELPSTVAGTVLGDRVLVWDPPEPLYDRGFYGQRLGGRGAEGGPLQLSLVEATYLADQGMLDLEGGADPRDRGREVEGERFDRRFHAYARLREAGVVPKSGFKFGADFRTYGEFESVDELGHSDHLVRVVGADHEILPRDLSLDVRLAVGVRKRMVFALVNAKDEIHWIAVDRLTP